MGRLFLLPSIIFAQEELLCFVSSPIDVNYLSYSSDPVVTSACQDDGAGSFTRFLEIIEIINSSLQRTESRAYGF